MELLDFAGPLEVLSVAGTVPPSPAAVPMFRVHLLATTPTIRTSTGLGYTIARDLELSADDPSSPGAPENFDAVLVPGGTGARQALRDETIIGWLQRFTSRESDRSRIVASVCTGALILAAAGVITAGQVATHKYARAELVGLLDGRAEVVDKRVVVTDYPWGRLMTCGGVTSGLDLSMRWIEEVAGRERAETTAEWIEYEGQGWK